ncbi:hypothetical protein LTR37_008533 [Vermiconidia calcicola]|uniref:Uncharacterized protein n=1 Tax=Vermiconidia calcicola TaxID=1690605 RepID=A0ACC3NA88_9PEZI|nr:hypothetical protein LTR37_008533 [Vermiconidia calcicola]
MASLATQDEIEEELEFQEVLISSLDPGADDYAERLAELEAKKTYLGRELEGLQSRSRPQTAEGHSQQQQGWNQMNGMDGSHDQYGGPGSSGYPTFSGSQMLQQNTLKRPLPPSVRSESQHPSKRPTPEPSNAGTPTSSEESYEFVEHPNADLGERARRRQMQAEAAVRRRREAEQESERLARSLSQPQNHSPAPFASFARPSVQTTFNNTGTYQRPPPPVKAESSTMHPPQRTPRSSQAYPGYQSPYDPSAQPRTPYIKPDPGASRQQQQSLVQRPRQPQVIDLTNSDDEDEDVSEIAPNGFTPSHRAQRPTFNDLQDRTPAGQRAPVFQPTPGAQFQRPMPGSYPVADQNGGQLVYGSGVNNFNGLPQRYPWMQQATPLLTNAVNGIRNVAGSLGGTFDELSSLINGSHTANNDDDDIIFGGSRQLDPTERPAAGYEDQDLYRRRYDEILNYDPAKTQEEINALLENIRPDEEMPAHLRVQTPDAMAIKLHKYQELGLTWLQKCENGNNKGGILADDMGLGKTIQMLSLMVTHKSDNPRCKTTLIVAPLALMRQWEQEIDQKVNRRNKLHVWVQHGQSKKKSFQDLQIYDVVLTTFGSLAAELRKLEKFEMRRKLYPGSRPAANERCALIGEDAQWYRVILDEAQCIKNATTQTAKAACRLNTTYRFCMTGTPMMNNVDEFHSLIKFLRIRPYAERTKFRCDITTPLKSGHKETRQKAMAMLQALCKAVMLRRTKKSTFEGKPILILPERTTDIENPEFNDDEEKFYRALENQTQLQFNRYLRNGTVGSSYSAVLVLLLRLRQACCHPYLLKDFGVAAVADVNPEQLVEFAKELAPQVVARIKETGGNFECPVCYDGVTNPAIFIPCGHDTCHDCFAKIADPANAIRDGNENATAAKCPNCRGPIDPKHITDFESFKRVHMPELLPAEQLELEQHSQEAEEDEGSETDSDSETESDEEDDDVDARGNLRGFIVNDDDEDPETASEVDGEAGPSKKAKKTKKKGKSSKKSKNAKGKKKDKGEEKKKISKATTLADLRKLANRSARARKAYLRRLRTDFKESSAKLDKTMETLGEIVNDAEGEKVLVFSQWTSLLDLLEMQIDDQGWQYRRYDGSMNAQLRNDAVDDLRDHRKDVRIMLVSLKAGNAGLNLNIASRVIILDPFWNPYVEEQAIDRAHRLGQTRPVRVHRILVKNTVEDRIIALQEKKRALISEALDEGASQNIGRLGVQELAYLFGVTHNPAQRVQYTARDRR